MSLEQEIKDRARELGFDAVGVTDAGPIGEADIARLKAWLQAGDAGQMAYLHRNFDKRTHPAALLDGARSVIMVALNYKPRETETTASGPGPSGVVATYARYEDYHNFMRARLHALADFIRARATERQRFKACVDSVPLAERALAMRAGLGFIGRNHMLIHPTLGPQIFLGALLTTVALSADEPTAGTCVGCDRCIRACPTGALGADGRFDATRCISYLTIEYQGDIAPELAVRMGDHVFGCDQCVRACPHHHAAPVRANGEIRFYPERTCLNLAQVLEWTVESFATEFAGSPIARPGLAALQRNARLCLANAQRQRGR